MVNTITRRIWRTSAVAAGAMLWLALTPQQSYAITDADKLVQDQIYKELRQRHVSTEDRTAVTWGGWVIPSVTGYARDDDANYSEFSFYSATTKLWLKAQLTDMFTFYLRGKNRYWRTFKRDNTPMDEWDNVLSMDIAAVTGRFWDKRLVVKLGRKFFRVGTGLILNGRADGGEMEFYSSVLNVKVLGAYSGFLQKDTNTYGLSRKEITEGAERAFFGGVLSKTVLNQKFYIFDIYQKDMNGDNQEYDSNYMAAGVKSVVGSLDVKAEFVYEIGTSRDTISEQESDIRAYAFNSSAVYYSDISTHPALYLNYAFASGDSDRISAVDVAGNSQGDDTGFVSFGTFSGGNALNPELSNLHIVRAGWSMKPLDFVEAFWLKRMSVITRYSYYHKYKEKAPISDPSATKAKGTVGHGLDVNLRWKIFSDLGFFAGYALFVPDEAYPQSAGNRTLFFSGLNIQF